MTPTTLAETILRDVPRYWQASNRSLQPATDGEWLSRADVLAALAPAMDPALSERAGEVLEGVTLAIDSDDDAYLMPSGAEKNLVALPARDDAYAIQHPEVWRAMVWRFNAYPALLAQNAALRAERDELSSKLEVERALTDAVHRLAKAAEAQIAALTARVEGLTGALEKINVGEGWAAQIARAALTTEEGHE